MILIFDVMWCDDNEKRELSSPQRVIIFGCTLTCIIIRVKRIKEVISKNYGFPALWYWLYNLFGDFFFRRIGQADYTCVYTFHACHIFCHVSICQNCHRCLLCLYAVICILRTYCGNLFYDVYLQIIFVRQEFCKCHFLSLFVVHSNLDNLP